MQGYLTIQVKITGPIADCILLAACNTAPKSAIAEDVCAGLSEKGQSDCLKLSSRIKSQLMLQHSSLGVGSGNSVSGGSGVSGVGIRSGDDGRRAAMDHQAAGMAAGYRPATMAAAERKLPAAAPHPDAGPARAASDLA